VRDILSLCAIPLTTCVRAGRAGRTGTAYTFIVPDEAQFAPDVVRALKDSQVRVLVFVCAVLGLVHHTHAQASIPQALLALAEDYARRRAAGELVATHGSGFGGKGFGFDAGDNSKVNDERRALRRAAGIDEEEEEEVDPDST
jgi:ATP-dependent RNA helicase DDX46/PRP5